jgi:threonine/homoserine/homoserine lactone efflux protein
MPPLDPGLYLTFLGSVFLLALAPGTDNIYVLTRSLAQGKRAGALAGVGIALALSLHITATTLGLSQVFLASPTLYQAVRFLGIAYLAYLAFRAFTAPPEKPELEHSGGGPQGRRIVGQAALLALLNPKLAIFFIAFLPQFTNPEAGQLAYQLFALGVTFAVESLAVFGMLVLCVIPLRAWLVAHDAFWRWQGKVTGGVLLALAFWLLVFNH